MRVAALALLLTLVAGSAASAFSATTGFSATIYASAPTALAGVAFSGTTLYAAEPSTGTIYRGTGSAPLALAPIAAVGGSPTGLASAAGQLYVARAAANDVVRVDPLSGAWTTIAAIPCPAGVAVDPIDGALFVTSCDALYRVSDPGGAASLATYPTPLAGLSLYGVTVGADDSVYVAAPSLGQVWRVGGPHQPAGLTNWVVAYVAGARGVTLVGSYLFVSTATGGIVKAPLPELGGSNLTALSAGDPGDLAAIGADGCVYAAQGTHVLRLADAAGGCELAAAAPPPPPPSLSLLRTSTAPPLVGGGDQTFLATLANAPVPGGVSVTFTVTGANSLTRVETTAPNGIATFAYSAATIGTDTIVATAVVGGVTITSNPWSITWPRRIDTAPPTITYTVTGDRGGSFGCPRTDIGTPGVVEYCGWFTSAPTITWTVTANGPSGIGPQTSCPPFTLVGTSPISGTPVTCMAYNGDGAYAALQVRLQATAAPPTITAAAVTSDGAPYAAGTPTRLPVTVTFHCDSALGAEGVSACTAPITVSADGQTTVSGSVVDVAWTTRTTTFGPIVIDTQGPVIAATVAPAPDAFGIVEGSGIVTLHASDPSGVASLTYEVSGAGASPPVTVSGPDASVTIAALGTSRVTFTAIDALGNASASGHVDLTVVARPIAYAETRFLVWGPRAGVGATVQLYGADWAKQVGDARARGALARFKGYAETVVDGVWTGRAGETVRPPEITSEYVSVFLTASAARQRDRFVGQIDGVAIVRIVPAPRGSPHGAIFGEVVTRIPFRP